MIERPTTEINYNISIIQVEKIMKRDRDTN